MTGVSITLDVSRVQAALGNLVRAAEDLRAPFDEIGDMLVASTIHRFETGTGPDGVAWIPSKRAQATNTKTLVERGRLRDSIVHEAGANFVAVGSNLVYAAIHQLGGTIDKEARSQVNLTAGKSSKFISAASARKRTKAKSRTVFGTEVTIGAHSVTIPARPYLGFSQEDTTEITTILSAHLCKGVSGVAK
jgi:phage virion morphogenesis protein